MSDTLNALLSTMLPGGDGFPSAADTNCAEWLSQNAGFRPAIKALLAKLPQGFETFAPGAQSDMLKRIEKDAPEVFDAATVAIYSAYYTRPEVLTAIEAARGYKAVPPQPGGYALPAFDPAILSVPQARGRQWRDPKTEASQ